MKTSFRVEGGAELAAALRSLPLRVNKRFLLDALRDAGEPMRKQISRLAPREPGAPDIAENIMLNAVTRVGSVGGGKSEMKGPMEAAVAIGPAKGFFYGFFQEWGTAHHGAQPFMRPGFEGEASGVITKLTRLLWTSLASRGIGRSVRSSGLVSGGPGGRSL